MIINEQDDSLQKIPVFNEIRLNQSDEQDFAANDWRHSKTRRLAEEWSSQNMRLPQRLFGAKDGNSNLEMQSWDGLGLSSGKHATTDHSFIDGVLGHIQDA